MAKKMISFGKYDGKPIEWIVVKQEKDKMLVVSANPLCASSYGSKKGSWFSSNVRSYLNHIFYKSCFSAEEKKQIVNTKLGDTKTKDDVFLLNVKEAKMLTKEERDRETVWWLRSDVVLDYMSCVNGDFIVDATDIENLHPYNRDAYPSRPTWITENINIDKSISRFGNKNAIRPAMYLKVLNQLEKEYNVISRVSNYEFKSEFPAKREYVGASCFVTGSLLIMSDGNMKKIEDVVEGDNVCIFNHYTGKIGVSEIRKNIHSNRTAALKEIVELAFSNGKNLKIVYDHSLYDIENNEYVSINSNNAKAFIGHRFALIKDGKTGYATLENVSIYNKVVNYYAPITKKHIGVIVEGFLTMPPTIPVNIFPCDENMKYDISSLERLGITPYEKFDGKLTREEYENYFFPYWDAIMENNPDFTDEMFDFMIASLRDETNREKRIC